MADSTQFGFCNLANFQLFVDKLPVFEAYLKLAVDTALGVQPERIHISGFCAEQSYLKKKRELPKNWQPDGEGGYWEVKPAHYWLETSEQPLEICTLGSGSLVNTEKLAIGRQTFAEQSELVAKVIELAKTKTFEKDVLPYIPRNNFRDMDINESLLRGVMKSAPLHSFDLEGSDEGIVNLTGEDLRGSEKIGYTITQNSDGDHALYPILKIGLCKAYYPK